ncbi:MAG TPA: hypothetical protein VN578_12420 [Candidatus Binatia bacterium]|jgi:hypothetical protein|nr:hypothetical protein [Candidatus Binatia bacterium]
MPDPNEIRLKVFTIVSGNSNCSLDLIRGYQDLRKRPIGMDDTAIAGMTPAFVALLKPYKQTVLSKEIVAAKTVSDLVDIIEKKVDVAKKKRADTMRAAVHKALASAAGVPVSSVTGTVILRSPPLSLTDAQLMALRAPLNQLIDAYGVAVTIGPDEIETLKTVSDMDDLALKDIDASDVF